MPKLTSSEKGQDLRSDEPRSEAERLEPSRWHYRQRCAEPERAEARQETVDNDLKRGVEHPEGRTLRQRCDRQRARSSGSANADDGARDAPKELRASSRRIWGEAG